MRKIHETPVFSPLGRARPPVLLQDQNLGGVRRLEVLPFLGASFKIYLTDVALVQRVSKPMQLCPRRT